MRFLLPAFAILSAACAASPPPAGDSERADREIARRIDEICALPETQREAELERLKKESGLVVHCGAKE